MISFCHPALGARSIAVVMAFLTNAVINHNTDKFDTWVSADFIQHNPFGHNGLTGGEWELLKPGSNITYTIGGVSAHCDTVMVYGRYVNFRPKPTVAMDIWRVKNGKIVEHWDIFQEEVPQTETASGNPMFTLL